MCAQFADERWLQRFMIAAKNQITAIAAQLQVSCVKFDSNSSIVICTLRIRLENCFLRISGMRFGGITMPAGELDRSRQLRQRSASQTAPAHPPASPYRLIRSITVTASSECPPSAKKLSCRPDSLQLQHLGPDRRELRLGLAPRRVVCAAASARSASGAGNALRSSFPFAVSGSCSSRTYAAGTMYSGRLRRQRRPQLSAPTLLPSSFAASCFSLSDTV